MPLRQNYFLYFLCFSVLMSACGVQSGGYRARGIPPLTEDSAGIYLSQQIDAFVQSLAPQTFNGAVMVEKGGELIIGNGYGYAQYQQKLPFTTLTLSSTAHLAQQFTAAAILRLSEKGALNLQDSLLRFFPDFPVDKQKIRIEQLLKHTSGLPNELSIESPAQEKKEFLAAVSEEDLLFTPGTSYQYSEAGYRLLAAIVEAASEQPYELYIREELLLPSKMENTGYVLPQFEQLVPAKEKGGDQSVKEIFSQYREAGANLWHLMGSSGILSTPEDVYRWERMWRRGKLLAPATIDLLRSWQPALPEGASFLGWTVDEHTFDTPLLQHNSRSGEFVTQVLTFPEQELVIVLLANQFNGQVEQLGEQIARMVLMPHFVPAPQPYAERKFVRIPQVKEARYARSLLAYLQGNASTSPDAIVDSVYSPAFKASESYQTHLNALTKLKSRLEGANLEKAQQAWPQYIFTFYEPQASIWYLLRLNVEQQAPYRITSIGLETIDALNARW